MNMSFTNFDLLSVLDRREGFKQNPSVRLGSMTIALVADVEVGMQYGLSTLFTLDLLWQNVEIALLDLCLTMHSRCPYCGDFKHTA
jgi:hypothetical protein